MSGGCERCGASAYGNRCLNCEDEENIKEEFNELIREKMNNKQFWTWVSEWYDVNLILDSTENWGIEDMKEAIKEIKKIMKR